MACPLPHADLRDAYRATAWRLSRDKPHTQAASAFLDMPTGSNREVGPHRRDRGPDE